MVCGVATVEHEAGRSHVGLARSLFDFQAAYGAFASQRLKGQSGGFD